MAEFPVDASREEIEALRAPTRRPFAPPPMVRRSDGTPPMFRSHGVARQARAVAFVARGVWMLACPFCPGCSPGIQAGDRLALFVCDLCGNAAAGGRPCETLWPTVVHTRTVERILKLRPIENRNWIPWSETTDMLRAENIEHGLPAEAEVA